MAGTPLRGLSGKGGIGMGPWIEVGFEYEEQYVQKHVTKKKTVFSGNSNNASLPRERCPQRAIR